MNNEVLGYLVAGAIVVFVFGFYAVFDRIAGLLGGVFDRLLDRSLPVEEDERGEQ